MVQFFTFLNFKGGVGKTTSCQNLGAALAENGHRVLLIDMDPQHNLSQAFKIEVEDNESVYHSLSELRPIKPQQISDNLHVAANDLHMIHMERELLAARLQREYRLREVLKGVVDNYDYILIDCPPALGMVTINALFASESNTVLIPIESEFLSLKGFKMLELALSDLKVHNYFVFLTKYDKRKVIMRDVKESIRRTIPGRLLKTIIRTNVRLTESQANGQSIIEYDPGSRGAQDYRAFASEIQNLSDKYNK